FGSVYVGEERAVAGEGRGGHGAAHFLIGGKGVGSGELRHFRGVEVEGDRAGCAAASEISSRLYVGDGAGAGKLLARDKGEQTFAVDLQRGFGGQGSACSVERVQGSAWSGGGVGERLGRPLDSVGGGAGGGHVGSDQRSC